MAAWSGFTDEDLRKMRNPSQEGDDDRRTAPPKRGMARRPRGSASRQKMDRPAAVSPSAQTQSIGSDERLSVNKSKKDASSKEKVTDVSGCEMKSDATETESVTTAQSSDPVRQEDVPKTEVVELSADQAFSLERDNVVKFQQQQKVIEEANKQKRALLSKAIEERRKMAKAEAQKLVKIQQELNHLDNLLNADVSIIRDKIEVASLDYAQAQKRYERAEKEFIEAKMDLFEKSESKERLTEHLYTIINQNEVRKAKKLVELMEQLAMQISPEELEMSMPSIPHLTNFTAASTIHQPGSSHGGAGISGVAGHNVNQTLDNETSNGVAEDGNCKTETKKEGASECGVGAIGVGSGEGTNSIIVGGAGEKGSSDGQITNDVIFPAASNDDDINTVVKSQPQSSESNDSNSLPSKQTVMSPDSEKVDPSVQNPSIDPSSESIVENLNENVTSTRTISQVSTQSPSECLTSSDANVRNPQVQEDVIKAKGWGLPFM